MLTIEKNTRLTLCVLLGGSGHRRTPVPAELRRYALCRLVVGSTVGAMPDCPGEAKRLAVHAAARPAEATAFGQHDQEPLMRFAGCQPGLPALNASALAPASNLRHHG